MPSHQRLERLTTLLQSQGSVQVASLAQDWGVSEMTVRRDLQRLQEQGLVERVYGGAVVSGGLRFTTRLDHRRREKQRAVDKLRAYIPDNGCLYLDGSTTIYHLIESIAAQPGLAVATNNVDTFHRLTQLPGITPLLIGGVLNSDTDNLVGPLARRSLEGLSFAAAYMSAFALDPELGPCEPSPADAEVKHLVARRARSIFIACDDQKLGRYASGSWQWQHAITTLATNLDPTDPRLDPYRSQLKNIL